MDENTVLAHRAKKSKKERAITVHMLAMKLEKLLSQKQNRKRDGQNKIFSQSSESRCVRATRQYMDGNTGLARRAKKSEKERQIVKPFLKKYYAFYRSLKDKTILQIGACSFGSRRKDYWNCYCVSMLRLLY